MRTDSELQLAGGQSVLIERHTELGSTNAVMRERFTDQHEQFGQFYSIVTDSQTAGRGRHERVWVATPGDSIAISTYVEFDADAARDSIGWVTLAAGVALRDAIVSLAPEAADRIRIKWPNDVQVDGKKVSGILGELLGVIDGGAKFACVIGTGINLHKPKGGYPFEHAIALGEVGIETAQEPLLRAYLDSLVRRIVALQDAGGDATASGLRGDLIAACSTIDLEVRVTRPDETYLLGKATGIGPGGDLIVRDHHDVEHHINVGDIQHVRPAEMFE